jgi:hypothetical protein
MCVLLYAVVQQCWMAPHVHLLRGPTAAAAAHLAELRCCSCCAAVRVLVAAAPGMPAAAAPCKGPVSAAAAVPMAAVLQALNSHRYRPARAHISRAAALVTAQHANKHKGFHQTFKMQAQAGTLPACMHPP